jgi:hypothetical protein
MKRMHLLPTLFLIASLAATEGLLVKLLWPSPPSDKEKIARLERLLGEKDRALDQLIIERDRGHRVAQAVAGSEGEASVLGGSNKSAESELEQATERARRAGRGDVGASNQKAALGVMSASIKASRESRLSVEEENSLDAQHLVTIANMITGKQSARFTKSGGRTAIEYVSGPWGDDDPLWKVLDSVLENESLERVVIQTPVEGTFKAMADRMREDLVSYGIPESKVVMKPANASGVLIALKGGGV